MILKLKILTVTLLLNCIVFSQKDTSKICLPYKTAQNVAKDLVQCDAIREELKETTQLVVYQRLLISHKDSVISIYEQKTTNYQNQISSYSQNQLIQNDMIFKLETENETLGEKLSFYENATGYLAGGLVAVMGLLTFIVTAK